MGADQSTRRITVQREDGSGVVQISESVLRRIRGDEEPESEISRPSRPSLPSPGVQERGTQGNYKEQLVASERLNAKIYETQKREFHRAVEEVEAKFVRTTRAPVCEDFQSAVIQCYSQHPAKPLLCADVVKSFNDCVDKTRQTVLTHGS